MEESASPTLLSQLLSVYLREILRRTLPRQRNLEGRVELAPPNRDVHILTKCTCRPITLSGHNGNDSGAKGQPGLITLKL